MSISQTDRQKYQKYSLEPHNKKNTYNYLYFDIFLSTRTISLYRKVVECNIKCEKVSENFKKFHIVSGSYNS